MTPEHIKAAKILNDHPGLLKLIQYLEARVGSEDLVPVLNQLIDKVIASTVPPDADAATEETASD